MRSESECVGIMCRFTKMRLGSLSAETLQFGEEADATLLEASQDAAAQDAAGQDAADDAFVRKLADDLMKKKQERL